MPKVIVGTRDTARFPEFAGNTWAHLQYMLGLQKLGLDVFWVDRLQPVDSIKHWHSLDYLVEEFDHMAGRFGFQDRYCIAYNGGHTCFGMPKGKLESLVKEADLLINISGHLTPHSPLMKIPRRAYIDLDPGFTQIWAHQVDMGFALHNSFFTVGQNVGRPDFPIPTRGIDWQTILPPIVLDHWPARIGDDYIRFSTIADWRGSQEAEYEGVYYGTKREEFIRFLRVPVESGQRIEVALCIGQGDSADIDLLDRHNWRLREPAWYTGDPRSYREFIQHSRAEFSVAKNGYVASNSGWLSDRTACYLASGKPVIVQSTGFEWRLPTGEGLITFSNMKDAVASIKSVNTNYLSHCRAARRLAEEYFDSDKVLGLILDRAGL